MCFFIILWMYDKSHSCISLFHVSNRSHSLLSPLAVVWINKKLCVLDK